MPVRFLAAILRLVAACVCHTLAVEPGDAPRSGQPGFRTGAADTNMDGVTDLDDLVTWIGLVGRRCGISSLDPLCLDETRSALDEDVTQTIAGAEVVVEHRSAGIGISFGQRREFDTGFVFNSGLDQFGSDFISSLDTERIIDYREIEGLTGFGVCRLRADSGAGQRVRIFFSTGGLEGGVDAQNRPYVGVRSSDDDATVWVSELPVTPNQPFTIDYAAVIEGETGLSAAMSVNGVDQPLTRLTAGDGVTEIPPNIGAVLDRLEYTSIGACRSASIAHLFQELGSSTLVGHRCCWHGRISFLSLVLKNGVHEIDLSGGPKPGSSIAPLYLRRTGGGLRVLIDSKASPPNPWTLESDEAAPATEIVEFTRTIDLSRPPATLADLPDPLFEVIEGSPANITVGGGEIVFVTDNGEDNVVLLKHLPVLVLQDTQELGGAVDAATVTFEYFHTRYATNAARPVVELVNDVHPWSNAYADSVDQDHRNGYRFFYNNTASTGTWRYQEAVNAQGANWGGSVDMLWDDAEHPDGAWVQVRVTAGFDPGGTVNHGRKVLKLEIHRSGAWIELFGPDANPGGTLGKLNARRDALADRLRLAIGGFGFNLADGQVTRIRNVRVSGKVRQGKAFVAIGQSEITDTEAKDTQTNASPAARVYCHRVTDEARANLGYLYPMSGRNWHMSQSGHVDFPAWDNQESPGSSFAPALADAVANRGRERNDESLQVQTWIASVNGGEKIGFWYDADGGGAKEPLVRPLQVLSHILGDGRNDPDHDVVVILWQGTANKISNFTPLVEYKADLDGFVDYVRARFPRAKLVFVLSSRAEAGESHVSRPAMLQVAAERDDIFTVDELDVPPANPLTGFPWRVGTHPGSTTNHLTFEELFTMSGLMYPVMAEALGFPLAQDDPAFDLNTDGALNVLDLLLYLPLFEAERRR